MKSKILPLVGLLAMGCGSDIFTSHSPLWHLQDHTGVADGYDVRFTGGGTEIRVGNIQENGVFEKVVVGTDLDNDGGYDRVDTFYLNPSSDLLRYTAIPILDQLRRDHYVAFE